MPTPQNTQSGNTSHEERAFFARLVAMNAMFEAARAGKPAQGFATRAQSSEVLLASFLEELKSSPV
jgi:hypothetical protein